MDLPIHVRHRQRTVGILNAAIKHEMEHEEPPLLLDLLLRLDSLFPLLLLLSHFGLLPHFLSLQAAHVRVPHWLNTAASWFLMTWLTTTRAALETLPQGLRWSIRLRGLAVQHGQT